MRISGDSTNTAKTEIPSSLEEDEFWISFGQSLISETINALDTRAQFMITTSASLLTVDFAVLLLASKIAALTVSPQFFLAISAFFFLLSLFPKQYNVNPWTPDKTRATYLKILNHKHRLHVIGFSMFFLALVLIAVSSFFIAA